MEKLLSIVIPTYNMQDYLHKCLDSLIIEKNFNLLDIIIVNDGSKDNSLKIAQEYVERYPSVYRVIDKPNGNYGSCVNIGLKNALGKYIKILDADDWFNTQFISILLDYIKDLDEDVIITDAEYERNGIRERMGEITLPTFRNLQMSRYLLSKNILCIQMHQVIYKTDLLRLINYHQSEGISYTDQEWIFLPIALAQTLYYIPIMLYVYLLGRDGQTMDKKNLIKCIGHTEKGVLKMIDDYNDYYKKISIVQQRFMQKRIYRRLDYIYRTYIFNKELQDIELFEFDKTLKSKNLKIYKQIETHKIHRFYPIPYIKMWRLHKGFIFLKLWKKIHK